MKKQEFISALKRALEHAPSHIREEILADISEHFTEAIAHGMTEEEVAQKLGDPRAIAAECMEEYGEIPRSGTDSRQENGPKRHYRMEYRGGAFGETKEIDIDETFDTVRDISVKLNDAKVRLLPSEDGRFRVTVRGDAQHTRIEVYNDGGTLTVTEEKVKNFFFWLGRGFKSSLKATVYIPAQFAGRIKVSNATGNIHAEGISGHLKLKTAAGNVHVENCTGESMKISTAAGNATMNLAGRRVGDIELSTAAGNAKIIADETRRLKVSSAAGNAEAQIQRLYGDTMLSSAAGSITLRAHFTEGNINISTAAGSAKIYLPQNVNCRIDAKKPAIGSISNQLEGNPNSPYVLRVSTAVGSVKLQAV